MCFPETHILNSALQLPNTQTAGAEQTQETLFQSVFMQGRMLVCIFQTGSRTAGQQMALPTTAWHHTHTNTHKHAHTEIPHGIYSSQLQKHRHKHAHTGGTPSTVGSSMLGQLLVCYGPFNCTHTHICVPIIFEQNALPSPNLSMNQCKHQMAT